MKKKENEIQELEKLAEALRLIGVNAKVEEIGTENEFLCANVNNHGVSYEWHIWYYDACYELHLFVDKECVYDQTYLLTPLFVVGQITSDIQKY